jgi:3-carboxy-cis,cis-muconate cycloisomerase
MVIDTDRMRKNLESTGGLIVAEAVMMGLAPHLGREAAHHAVKHACDRALMEKITLADALAREPEVTEKLARPDIERMTDPLRYLGGTETFIDRVLEHARSVG